MRTRRVSVMTDTAIAADLRAREEASDPSRSIVLQAPAGSGKTTVLTQRFLKLLATVDEPEEILAVTFTRKAAAAMRAGILRELADTALASAKARDWDLLNHPSRLRIQTIDSFNFWIASQLPVTAKAGGTLVVDDRPEELYARAARMTLVEAENDAELAPDIELLFERLDNRWDHVEELLAQMLAERAHWLRHVVGSAPEALRARMTASLRDLTVDALVGVRAQLPADLVALLETLPEVGSLGCGAQDLPGWQRLTAAVLTLKGAWRKPRGRAVTDLSRAIADLSALPGVLDEFLDIRCLPPAELDPDDARMRGLRDGWIYRRYLVNQVCLRHIAADANTAGRAFAPFLANRTFENKSFHRSFLLVRGANPGTAAAEARA